MLTSSPKYRRPISSNQELLLKLLYKFRFVTSDLLAEILQKSRSTIYESLYVLEKQGYVHKLYGSNYRLRHLPARYTLAPKGIKYLLAEGYGNPSQLRYFYRNKSAKAEHIAHSLEAMWVFCLVKQHSGKTFRVLSGSEIANSPDYIRPLPDLRLRRRQPSPDKPNLYLLEVLREDIPFWKHTRRLKAHQRHYEEDWQYSNYPTLLLVAPDYRTERYMLKVVENRWFDFNIWVTNRARMDEAQHNKIWATDFDKDEELVCL